MQGADVLYNTYWIRFARGRMTFDRAAENTGTLFETAETGLAGLMLRDLALARDEIDGLMAGLLTSDAAPIGTTELGAWLRDNAGGLGRRYVSELGRNSRL